METKKANNTQKKTKDNGGRIENTSEQQKHNKKVAYNMGQQRYRGTGVGRNIATKIHIAF